MLRRPGQGSQFPVLASMHGLPCKCRKRAQPADSHRTASDSTSPRARMSRLAYVTVPSWRLTGLEWISTSPRGIPTSSDRSRSRFPALLTFQFLSEVSQSTVQALRRWAVLQTSRLSRKRKHRTSKLEDRREDSAERRRDGCFLKGSAV